MRKNATKSKGPEFRVNLQIRVPQIRVIGPNKDQLGVMTPAEARQIALENDLDLVEVSPTAKPPVCRIMDYGKFRYDQSKKASATKTARVELKTLRMRPKTGQHDVETILRKARNFLGRGDRVKLELRMRGREQAHPRLWMEKMNEVTEALADTSTVTQHPRIEGRMISAILEPTEAKA